MNVGQLIETKNEQGEAELKGKLSTYKLSLGFKLVKNENRQNNDSPTHIIIGRNVNGDAFQAGSAWQQIAPKTGMTYYSLSVFIPEVLDTELRYTAFQSNHQTEGSIVFDIITQRQKQQPTQAAA